MTTHRARLLRWLRVPPEPAAPAGDEHVRIFRAAPNYFRYRLFLWGGQQAVGVIGLVAYLVFVTRLAPEFGPPRMRLGPFMVTEATLLTLLMLAEIVGIIVYMMQMIASAAILRLDFEQRWYFVSDRSLRIREGLVRLHEKTMTFANVQHVGIRQNPIQRWLGIADVEVRTAGGGAGNTEEQSKGPDLHIGYLRGVNEAARIRDVIRQRLKRHTDAGLGDPDDVPATAPPSAMPAPRHATVAPELAAAAAALRDEARALRLALGGAAPPLP